jgi:hypothetical protein
MREKMMETMAMEKPAYPGALKEFFDNGGDLASDKGLQLLEKYDSRAIARIAKDPRAEKQLIRAHAEIQGNNDLKKRIFLVITGQL